MAVGFLVAVTVPLIFAWLYRMAAREPAIQREDAYVFGAPKALKVLLFVAGLFFAVLTLWSGYAAIRSPSPDNPIWAPFAFAGFCLFVPFALPGTLQTDETGITRTLWYRRTLHLDWHDVERIELNTQGGSIVVLAEGGRKLQHFGGFYVGPGVFLREVLRNTRLPLTLVDPGIWKAKKTEMSNERALEQYAADYAHRSGKIHRVNR
jgi:hypothetical protein